MMLVLIFGFSPLSIIVFEIILSSCSLFKNSNLKFNKKLDSCLRFFLVTPDMHKIHHSIHSFEHNSNYGFNFSFWDKVFKTYTKKSIDADKITIGLTRTQKAKTKNIFFIFGLPFKK